jgi:signal transduction histidine kinase
MASGVVKELNAPLCDILDRLHQLNNTLETTSEEQRNLLVDLHRDALHCQQTINSLLDFAGQRSYKFQEVNINDAIEAAWKKYAEEFIIDNQIEFVPGFDPKLPYISADGNQLEHALFCLIRNAHGAMPQGGTIRVITRMVGPQLQIIINDTGSGLSPEDMRHIFDPYYETDQHAYGLDLSIAQAIIERHHGTIEVESESEQGTSFTIRLPVTE